MTTTGAGNENDSTAAGRGLAAGSKNQTTPGAIIKGLFRGAVKAIMEPAGETPEPVRKRRGGETEVDFRKLVRTLTQHVAAAGAAARGRYAALRFGKAEASPAFTVPAEILDTDPEWNVFDITNPWHDHGDDPDGSGIDAGFDAHEHLSPGL